MPSCQQQKDQKNNVSDSKKGIKSLSQDHQKSAKLCQQQKDRKTWLKGRSTIIVTWFKQKKLFLNQQQKGQKNLEGHKTMWLPPKKAWNHYHKIFKVAPIFLIPQLFHPSIVWWLMLTWGRRPNFFILWWSMLTCCRHLGIFDRWLWPHFQ